MRRSFPHWRSSRSVGNPLLVDFTEFDDRLNVTFKKAVEFGIVLVVFERFIT